MFKRWLCLFTCAILMFTVLLPQEVVASEFEIRDGILVKYNGIRSTVVIPNNVTAIANNAFNGNTFITTVTIPNSVKYIEEFAFIDCVYLTTVNFAEGVLSIGMSAFKNCFRLQNIKFPNSLKTVGSNAFENCVSLKTIDLGKGIEGIGTSAFANCIALTEIAIPKSLLQIGSSAFAGCIALENFTTESDSLGFDAYEGVLYSKDGQTLVAYPQARAGAYSLLDGTINIAGGAFSCAYNLTSLSNTYSVENVGNFAFFTCTSLNSIELPNATNIGKYAFIGSSSLRSVIVGGAKIGEYAFGYCESLKVVVVGSGSKTILDSAFEGCTNLTSIILPSTIAFMGSDVFYNSKKVTIMTMPGTLVYNFATNVLELPIAPISEPSKWAAEDIYYASDFIIAEMQVNYQANTTRAEFCYAVIKFLEVYYGTSIEKILAERELSLGSFSDTTDRDVLAANALGIVNGYDGRFDPNSFITREQAAVLLNSVLTNVFNLTTELSGEIKFADADAMSSWSRDAISNVSAKEVMFGSYGRFNPKGYYTHEQSVITLLRLFAAIENSSIEEEIIEEIIEEIVEEEIIDEVLETEELIEETIEIEEVSEEEVNESEEVVEDELNESDEV